MEDFLWASKFCEAHQAISEHSGMTWFSIYSW